MVDKQIKTCQMLKHIIIFNCSGYLSFSIRLKETNYLKCLRMRVAVMNFAFLTNAKVYWAILHEFHNLWKSTISAHDANDNYRYHWEYCLCVFAWIIIYDYCCSQIYSDDGFMQECDVQILGDFMWVHGGHHTGFCEWPKFTINLLNQHYAQRGWLSQTMYLKNVNFI